MKKVCPVCEKEIDLSGLSERSIRQKVFCNICLKERRRRATRRYQKKRRRQINDFSGLLRENKMIKEKIVKLRQKICRLEAANVPTLGCAKNPMFPNKFKK